jgi:hypothetical protein
MYQLFHQILHKLLLNQLDFRFLLKKYLLKLSTKILIVDPLLIAIRVQSLMTYLFESMIIFFLESMTPLIY